MCTSDHKFSSHFSLFVRYHTKNVFYETKLHLRVQIHTHFFARKCQVLQQTSLFKIELHKNFQHDVNSSIVPSDFHLTYAAATQSLEDPNLRKDSTQNGRSQNSSISWYFPTEESKSSTFELVFCLTSLPSETLRTDGHFSLQHRVTSEPCAFLATRLHVSDEHNSF